MVLWINFVRGTVKNLGLSDLVLTDRGSFGMILTYLIVLLLCRMIGEIGFKHIDLLPQIVPLLITVLTDDTPAVVRQSITCAINLFRVSLVKIAMKVTLFCMFYQVLKLIAFLCNASPHHKPFCYFYAATYLDYSVQWTYKRLFTFMFHFFKQIFMFQFY